MSVLVNVYYMHVCCVRGGVGRSKAGIRKMAKLKSPRLFNNLYLLFWLLLSLLSPFGIFYHKSGVQKEIDPRSPPPNDQPQVILERRSHKSQASQPILVHSCRLNPTLRELLFILFYVREPFSRFQVVASLLFAS